MTIKRCYRLIIIAFVFPIVYASRRLVLKKPKFTSDVSGDHNTRPVILLSAAVAIGLGISFSGHPVTAWGQGFIGG